MANSFTSKDLVVGRVVSEDSGFILIEIMKHDTDTFTLQEGDRFYTLMFVRQVDDGVEAWKPWRA